MMNAERVITIRQTTAHKIATVNGEELQCLTNVVFVTGTAYLPEIVIATETYSMSVERVADLGFQKETVTATVTFLMSVERVVDLGSQKENVIATETYSMSVERVAEEDYTDTGYSLRKFQHLKV